MAWPSGKGRNVPRSSDSVRHMPCGPTILCHKFRFCFMHMQNVDRRHTTLCDQRCRVSALVLCCHRGHGENTLPCWKGRDEKESAGGAHSRQEHSAQDRGSGSVVESSGWAHVREGSRVRHDFGAVIAGNLAKCDGVTIIAAGVFSGWNGRPSVRRPITTPSKLPRSMPVCPALAGIPKAGLGGDSSCRIDPRICPLLKLSGCSSRLSRCGDHHEGALRIF